MHAGNVLFVLNVIMAVQIPIRYIPITPFAPTITGSRDKTAKKQNDLEYRDRDQRTEWWTRLCGRNKWWKYGSTMVTGYHDACAKVRDAAK